MRKYLGEVENAGGDLLCFPRSSSLFLPAKQRWRQVMNLNYVFNLMKGL